MQCSFYSFSELANLLLGHARLRLANGALSCVQRCIQTSAVLLLTYLGLTASVVAEEQKITVFDQYSKARVATVTTNNNFTVLQAGARWSLIQFSEPTVPVWASKQYLSIENGQATVLANRLNLRTTPSLDATVLISVSRGYRSPVVAAADNLQTEFAQILAPVDLRFAVLSDSIGTVNQTVASQNAAENRSNWRTSATVNQGVSNSATAPEPVTNPAQPALAAVESTVSAEQPSGQPSGQPSANTAMLDEQSASTASTTAPSTQSSATNVVETPEEKNSIALQHRLFPGDTISLLVFGEEDLSMSNVRIPQSGQVSFPLVGAIPVVGKTTTELEADLRETLSQGYVRNPRLTVTIDSYRPIFVLGAAQSIGSFPYSEGLTVAKAIAVAGGAKNSARKDGISILRDGKVVQQGLSLNSQYQVLSGDIITLEEDIGVGEEAAAYVYLHGEVRSPGEYEYRRGLTVEKAVVLAGGFSLRASRRKISVSRIVEGEEKPQKLKKVALHLPVQPGDIIDVGASWF